MATRTAQRLLAGTIAGSVTLATAMLPAVASTSTTRAQRNVSQATTSKRTVTRPTATTKRTVTTKSSATSRSSTTPFAVSRAPYAKFLKSVAADLDAWWSVELPARFGGVRYRAMKGYYAFTSVSAMPPGCGTEVKPRYEDVAGNAYYCPTGDFVAFDDEGLFPDMVETLGTAALGVVLAHEMGHAVQVRAGVSMPSVFLELQADCFAGAWLRRVTSGRSARVQLPASTIDEAILAGLEFSDSTGTAADSDGAHGDGFDRVNSIHLGWQYGLTRCVTFPVDPPEITASVYSSAQEQATNGNVSMEVAVTTATGLLDSFWAAAVTGYVPVGAVVAGDAAGVGALQKRCVRAISLLEDLVVVCPSDYDGRPMVLFDDARMRRIYRGAGDFGVSTVLALAWSALAQHVAGQPTADQASTAELRAICTMGAWSGAMFRGTVTGGFGLSPGDLDEATAILLLLTWRSAPFDRIDHFRDGFDDGLSACA